LKIPKRNQTILSILILGFGLLWIFMSARSPASADRSIPAPRPGFPAPDISLLNLDGHVVQLTDYHGRVVMVNFWASWCPPCRAEMAAFQEIFTEYEDQGFVILAVNDQESRAAALGFAQSHALTFPILLDEDGEVSKRYRVASLPATFFINKNGYIDEVTYGGPISEALLRVEIAKLLGDLP
jgi:peroxiredoxin